MAEFILPDVDDSELRGIADELARYWRQYMVQSGVPVRFANNIVRDTVRNARQHNVAMSCVRAGERERREAARVPVRLKVVE